MEKRFGCDRTVIKGRSPLTRNNCKSMRKWTKSCLNNKWKSWDIYLLSFDTLPNENSTLSHSAAALWMASKIWLKMFFCELRVSSTATKKALFTFILSPTCNLPCCEAMGNIYSGHQNARNNYFWNVKSHFFLQKSIVYFYPITGQWSLLSELIVWKRGKLCCEDCFFCIIMVSLQYTDFSQLSF